MTAPAGSPIHVLLVEDNPADADLVVETLDDAPNSGTAGRAFAVVHVQRLAAALGYLADHEVDVALLDLSLPDGQGLETFRRMHEQAPDLPVVVLSGLADGELAAQAVREGAQDYLVKGESDHRLLSRALRYAIERQRAETERVQLIQRENAARARAEAAEAGLRERDAFLAIASHELRTPLTALLGGVQVLVRQAQSGRTPEPAVLVERLRAAERLASKLGRLVAQLVDISRLAQGPLHLDLQETDLLALVQDVVETVQVQTTAHCLRVSGHGRPWLSADPLRLEQVFRNLLDNAVKFSPEGGDIEIDVAEPEPGTARVSVCDHGLGIPADRRGRLFAPYYQAHADEYRSGLGLSLYVSRRIVELHGGTIRAEFPAEGGAQFVIDLPSGAAPADAM